MVFESLVTDVLNRFLGDYIENLDSKQLKIGIWGGDVVLNNLILKQSALSDLDLPVQTVFGRLDKLVLKIPWKNLYGAAVEASIEGLYLLVKPNSEVTYNAEREEKRLQDAKIAELQKIELAKKRAQEEKKADDTLVEKLVTQIIKNVQLSIKNIHIRYEDSTSAVPYSMGITLGSLNLHTTDENWKATIVQESVKRIYKVVTLDSLSVYWNCNSQLYSDLPKDTMRTLILEDIAVQNSKPEEYKYILGPINSAARLILNPKPENDSPQFVFPKAHAELVIENLHVAISKLQYKDIINFADSMSLQSTGLPYRKFRPNVSSYKGHYREWWLFAYKCILETEVKRRRLNWDWEHMTRHRVMCKDYGDAYRNKLQNKKLTKAQQEQLCSMENKIDLFNIVLIRERIEMEVVRIDKKIEETKPKGWFSGWWRSSTADEDIAETTNILAKFQKAMTPEEKEKLFKAIDYTENVAPLHYPIEYVDNIVKFHLKNFEFNIVDDSLQSPNIINTKLQNVKCRIETRPANAALKLAVFVEKLDVFGMDWGNHIPHLISSQTDENSGLLDVLFEINPLNSQCGQRVHVNAQPLRVIFDARTVFEVINVFKVPSSSALEQLSQVTALQLNNIKDLSATGMQHIIETHTYLDLNICLHAPYIVIPYDGKYTGAENSVILNLGKLSMISLPRNKSAMNIQQMIKEGIEKEDVLNSLIEQSYDKFQVELMDIQVMIAQGDENWLKHILGDSSISQMHLLTPLSIHLTFHNCLISDDPKLPLSKMDLQVPSMKINATDARLMLLLNIVKSITRLMDEWSESSDTNLARCVSSLSLPKFMEFTEQKPALGTKAAPKKENQLVQMTQLVIAFELKELEVQLSHQEFLSSEPEKLLLFNVSSVKVFMTQQTFNLQVDINLQSISMMQIYNHENIEVIKSSNPHSVDSNYLLNISYTQVDKKSPELFTKYESCLSTVNLEFVSLTMCLHQEALLELLKYLNDIESQLEDQQVHTVKRSISITSASLMPKSDGIIKKKKRIHKDLIFLNLKASVNDVTINFTNKDCTISIFSIEGVKSQVIMRQFHMYISVTLRNIAVDDLNPLSIHQKILMLEPGEEALNLSITIVDPSDERSKKYPYDIAVHATLGCIKVTFVQWFVNNMLEFLNKFQMARKAISEASEKAAKTAKENVHNLYEKATKISLDIKLKAPEIIIPESSSSPIALLVDLGYITISNKFVELDIHNDLGDPVVIDELVLLLEQLKIERVIDKKRIILLEPLSFSLHVNRNLSFWYQAIPGIDINGSIDTMQLLLSQLDYKTIMNVLALNLTEGKVEFVEVDRVQRCSSDIEAVMAQHNLIESLESSDEQVTTLLRWNFIMKCFKINLLTNSNLDEGNAERVGLAELSLDGFAVRGSMLSNDALSNSCLLVNCRLTDIRPGREDKINCLLSRLEDPVETKSILTNKNMIDMTFQKKMNDTFIDVRVYSFTFILSIEYMLKLSSFFQIESAPQKTVTSHLGSTKQAVPETMNNMMTVTLKIEKPDIILVEHMDSIDTRALILHCEMLMKLRFVDEHQSITGNLKDIQMYTCIFDHKVRETSRNYVLEPVSVSIAGSTPQNRGLHIEVYISEMQVKVSLYTMELINNILNTLATTQSNVQDDTLIAEDYSDLWNVKHVEREKYWFLREEIAQDALAFVFVPIKKKQRSNLHEMCIINMPVFLFTLEAGVGNKTFPMLLLETNFQGKISNWSSKMMVEATLALQMGYYNSHLALWEPLIEPVTVKKDKNTTLKPWELKLEVSMNEIEGSGGNLASPTDSEEVMTGQAAMEIEISSSTNLELTMTKSSLQVLNSLANLFASAISADTKKSTGEEAPYKVVNSTGLEIILDLDISSFCLFGKDVAGEVRLGLDAEVTLDTNVARKSDMLNSILMRDETSVNEYYLAVTIPEFDMSLKLPVNKANRRVFKLKSKGSAWGFVSSVNIENGVTIVILSSILRVHNTFNVPIDMYYMRSSGNELEFIATIQPGSAKYVPMKAVYSPTSEVFFSVENYSVTTSAFVWKDMLLNLVVNKNLTCVSKKDVEDSFVISTVGEMTQVYYETTLKHTMASATYDIYLRPAVVLKNCLPISITVTSKGTKDEFVINPGDRVEIPNVEPGKDYLVIYLPDYLEKLWTCKQEVSANPAPFSVWTFDSHDSAAKMSLDLGMHILNNNGSFDMSLYCPFWMLNKTGLNISYRKSKKTEKNESSGSPLKSSDENLNILHHPPFFKGPILFSFNAKNFFGKKKACVRVEQGDWSDKFSIDVAGSSGVIACKYNGKIYQLGVNNRLTYNGLTKQITFTPYYVIINSTSFAIECQEFDRPADAWIKVAPKSCTALFPYSEQDNKLIKLRLENTDQITPPFMITESHTTLLKLKNKWGGINVDIQLTEGAAYINLAMYDEGTAPALIINDTKHTMNFWEKNTVQIKKLPPQCSMFYTWDNPSGQRVLVWEGGYKKEYENELRMDDVGKYPITDELCVYWVSFLDGMQRVLFFTCDEDMAGNIQASKQFEKVDREITVSIYGIGLSLVNNVKREEILYLGVAGTGIIWETCKITGTRFKPMSTKDNITMERAYQQYLLNEAGAVIFNLEGGIEVNFGDLIMLKPHKRIIRRHFQTGFWAQMKSSKHQMQIHAKINRLQIDNQLYDCTFPVLLAPVPPPKTISVNNAHKPFAELSIVQLLIKNSQIQQFKYFKVLIQEFHVKVDLAFINHLMEIFDTSANSEDRQKQEFLLDVEKADEALYMLVSNQSIQEQKSFYDLLHFSPLKIHVSFSMASGSNQISSIPNFLNVLLQGIGVTLTDLQDVIFKLAFFQRDYSFLTRRQLMQEATQHYLGQSVKQLYVLVLGLDVIGNPYGLVLGITKGVEDLFYEPFQGAIQGPGEFAEGLVLGVRSLFGHTVGGAAGAVSRITGAMGKGIAALTFDKDYQRKRRDQINKKPATVQAGLARGGKGLVMGVFDGVTGVFTKPISGAKEQGVGGFFKGLGKGAVGLVTRPTAGVMDFASTSFESVKRVTDFGHEEVHRLRSPRFVQADRYVKPYDEDMAYGNKLLCELEKGKYSTTDIYSCHFVIIAKKEVLIFSNKRLAYITHNDMFGGWQVDWSYTWQDLDKKPKIVARGVQIFSDGRKKGLFSGNDASKVILISDESTSKRIVATIERHMNNT